MGDIFNKKFLIGIFSAAILYSTFVLLTDLNLISNQLSNFDILYIPLILSFIFLGWLVLFSRWVILLNYFEIKLPTKTNFLIYLAGFTFAISPGKSGEFFKAILLKNKFGISRTKSISVIFLERFYDLIGTILVAICIVFFLGNEFLPVLYLGLISIAVIFYLAFSKRGLFKIISLIHRIKFFKKFLSPIENSHNYIQKSRSPKLVIISILLTILHRLVEGVGLFFIISAFGFDLIGFFEIVTTYSTSVIIGTITLIPGGMGITEGSLGGLLSLYGLEFSIAIVIAIVIRLFTLWFAIGAGAIALKFSKSLQQSS